MNTVQALPTLADLKLQIDWKTAYPSLLRGPSKKTGGQEYYFCPFHDDQRTPNLTFDDNGNFKCFACNRSGDVIDLYRHVSGVSNSYEAAQALVEKFGNGHAPLNGGNGQHKPQTRNWLHQDQTRAKVGIEGHPDVLKQKAVGYKLVGIYSYADSNGWFPFHRVRMEHETRGKWCRAFHFNGAWINGEPPDLDPKPTYLSQPEKTHSETVYIVEGEKCVDTLSALGLCAATSGSSTSAQKADWGILKAQGFTKAIIWPDNDNAGQKYSDTVAEKVSVLGLDVKKIEVSGLDLPPGGDVVDWLEKHPAASIETIEALPTIEGTATVGEDWPDPEPINKAMPEVQPFPTQLMPDPFGSWIEDVANRMQCPIDFLAAAVMVFAGSTIGAGCGVRPKRNDDWLVIPNLWGGVVGRPGMLKTPAINEMLKPITQLEKQTQRVFEKALKEFELDKIVYEAEQDALKTELKKSAQGKTQGGDSVETIKQKFATLEAPDAPTWKRFKTNDATIEKMGELLSENQRGILLFRDELVGLLATWDKEGRESDRAFFLEAWNGNGSHTTDRIGRGTIYTENLCVSLFGGIQPDKLEKYLYQTLRGFSNDGLLQRIQLLVYPDKSKEWELVDTAPDMEVSRKAHAVFSRLADMDFQACGASTKENEETPYFQFDDAAQRVFYEWLTELEREKIAPEESPVLAEHLAKYRSLMPSLALIFHVIELADGKEAGPIPENCARMAASWCQYLESHARRIYSIATNPLRQATSKLSEKLQSGSLEDTFTKRDVYRKGWMYLDDSDLIEKACDELVEAGWIMREDEQQQLGKGGRPNLPTYRINPKIRGNQA